MQVTTIRKSNTPSPEISPLPPGTGRLIDVGLLHYEASIAGFAERYGRGETSHTIHVWWARRPHTAMRALTFASLCKDTSQSSLEVMRNLSQSGSATHFLIEKARGLISKGYNSTPKLLDMFGGGGTIPLEALRLGADTYSIDSNQLSVFIQKCNLVYSQRTDNEQIASLIEETGRRVIDKLTIEIAPLFPIRKPELVGYSKRSSFAYFWTYSTLCENCGFKYYLSKRTWLSKKKNKKIALMVTNSDNEQHIEIKEISDSYNHKSVWTGRNGQVKCPKCGTVKGNIDIKKCKEEMVAMARLAPGKGKEYIPPDHAALPSEAYMHKIEKELLEELEVEYPDDKLPKWSGIVNPALYGVSTYVDFLTKRQRLVLLYLIKALTEEYKGLLQSEPEETAKFIIAILSSLMDQLIDWNCRLSMWIPQNEQVGRAFCGPGVAMLWDFVETDPVLSGPANLWSKLKRIVDGVRSMVDLPRTANVLHAYAQSLPFKDDFFDAIVTDPPYYDNIYYSVLADFFYVWKRLLLNKIEPDLFNDSTTDYTHELVASTYRNGTTEKAHDEYCNQLLLAIKEAARVLKPDGVFSFIYSHSSLAGWEALIKAYRAAPLTITSSQPLSIERKQRPRAMTSEAVNTCITFVAHKTKKGKPQITLQELSNRLHEICVSDFAENLRNSGWNNRDIGIALYAHGVALLANVKTLSDCETDKKALTHFEEIVKETVPEFKVQKRKSL